MALQTHTLPAYAEHPLESQGIASDRLLCGQLRSILVAAIDNYKAAMNDIFDRLPNIQYSVYYLALSDAKYCIAVYYQYDEMIEGRPTRRLASSLKVKTVTIDDAGDTRNINVWVAEDTPWSSNVMTTAAISRLVMKMIDNTVINSSALAYQLSHM
jgi:hypothetical protein